MISEGSCDTEDWSNDAENTALYHRNKLHLNIFKTENSCVKWEYYFIILLFLQYFWPNNRSLGEHKKLFKNLSDPNLFHGSVWVCVCVCVRDSVKQCQIPREAWSYPKQIMYTSNPHECFS